MRVQVERAWLVTETGAAVELEAGGEGAPPGAPTFAPVGRERSMTTRAAASAVDRRQRTMQEARAPHAQALLRLKCGHNGPVARRAGRNTLTDMNAAFHTTRGSFALNSELPSLAQVTVQYNLCNEPWVKYSMAGVSDRGLAPSLWTSARLHHHVLYLETHK